MEGTCHVAHAGPCWTLLVPVTSVMADGGHRRAQTPATAARHSRSVSQAPPRGRFVGSLCWAAEGRTSQFSHSPVARHLRSTVGRAMLYGRVVGWRLCPQPLRPLLALWGAALAASSGHLTPLLHRRAFS